MTNSQATGSGSLYIVATPIGNLDDISLRAIEVLKSVDFILAEDTRHSRSLLNHLGIKKSLSSLHAHNEAEKSLQIIQSLIEGQSAALISDAGTPLISDPGYPLVTAARQKDIDVIPVPGPCAFVAALSAAGVPCDTFTFAGFLPAKQAARIHSLEALNSNNHTLIFYESTHRIKACIIDCITVFGENAELVLAKELTKAYERFISGRGQEIIDWFNAEPGRQKGEFVLIVPPRHQANPSSDREKVLSILLEELPLKQAVKLASLITEQNKNELYQLALKLKEIKP